MAGPCRVGRAIRSCSTVSSARSRRTMPFRLSQMRASFRRLLLVVATVAIAAGRSGAQQAFPLVEGGRATPLLVSGGDHAGVVRAVGDLRADVERVTGLAPSVSDAAGARVPLAVIVGTIGHSALIDSLVAHGRLDVRDVKGKWESYRREVVSRQSRR